MRQNEESTVLENQNQEEIKEDNHTENFFIVPEKSSKNNQVHYDYSFPFGVNSKSKKPSNKTEDSSRKKLKVSYSLCYSTKKRFYSSSNKTFRLHKTKTTI